MSEDEPITAWIAGIKQGDSFCAHRLYQALSPPLMRLANRRFAGTNLGWADEEDVALSTFRSFFLRASAGDFPKLENRHDLWSILVRIVSRKVGKLLRKERRLKRGGGKPRDDLVIDGGDSSLPGGLDHVVGNEPAPDWALITAEACQSLLESLSDPTLTQIAIWKLEGFTDVEVSEKLNCATRTVERKLQRIRAAWLSILNANREG